MPTQTAQSLQLLIFALGEEEYALTLTDAREIIRTPEITPVPNMPTSIAGVVNIRGKVITVVDAAVLFGIQKNSASEKKHIIVTERDDELFGLLVDAATEVHRTTKEHLSSKPDLIEAHAASNYIDGMIVLDEQEEARIILLLNLQNILEHCTSAS